MLLPARDSAYSGPLQAVVLDWAGTTVDCGCLGPAAVFVDVFAQHGIRVTASEVRRFMGYSKRDHVAALLELPAVVDQWRRINGRAPAEADVDRLYADTVPMMIAAVARHADPIPGALEAVDRFRAMGLKIGSCTGYTRSMLEVLAAAARQKGYAPEAMVCASDVPAGRPAPFMCYLNAVDLNVYPMAAMAKIGDTVADIQEGRNAGMWTIGVIRCGNEIGLPQAELEQMDPEELRRRMDTVARSFRDAGAHYVAEDLGDCVPILEDINRRLARGEQPSGAPCRAQERTPCQTST